jgi:hypothetical protein
MGNYLAGLGNGREKHVEEWNIQQQILDEELLLQRLTNGDLDITGGYFNNLLGTLNDEAIAANERVAQLSRRFEELTGAQEEVDVPDDPAPKLL